MTMSNNLNDKKIRVHKSKLSILPIVLSGLLAGGSIAGSAVSIWHIAKNYTEGAEFTKTVNGRIKIDPFAQYEGDKDIADAQRITNECAKKLSRWLKDRGQKNYDVTSECYETDESNVYDCYLNAQFEINKVTNNDPGPNSKEEKIDGDPYSTFFSYSGFNSNEQALVYRWYTTDHKEDAKPEYTIIPFRQAFTLPTSTGITDTKARTLVNDDGKNGVVLQTNDDEVLTKIYKNFVKAKEESKPDSTGNAEVPKQWMPRLYIVNNLSGLFNEANYCLSFWWKSNKGDDHDFRRWYSKASDYETFSSNYVNKKFDGTDEKQTQVSRVMLQSSEQYDKDIDLDNMDLFNYVDQDTPGTVNVSFANKYINKVLTVDNFTSIMPEKITDDYKNVVDKDEEKIDYFWYETDSKGSAEAYLNNQITYGFNEASITASTFTDTGSAQAGGKKVYEQITTKDFQNRIIPPTYTETIFGGSQLIGILSLGFLIFLIALLVILAVLYRTTGVMSWICMIFALSMTGLIATISSTAITMSLLFGLFSIAIVGFMVCLGICGRLKRRLLSREDTHVMINKTFKRSLLPSLDLSIITLIFGVCFTYIAPLALNSFGLVLVIGAFAIFISVYLLNGLLHVLLFNNQRMFNKYQFFGKPSNVANEALYQNNSEVPATLDAVKLNISYYSSMSKRKINVTNMKTLIAVCVVATLLLAGIIYFSVAGYVSSEMFHTESSLTIKYNGDLLSQSWFISFDYSSMKHYGEWWYFYTNTPNLMDIAKTIESGSGLTMGTDIFVQSIFGSTNQDILNFALVSIIVATLVSSVYGAIRNNWIAFIPMVVGSFIMPLLILGTASLCQIKFDQTVVIAFAMVSIINTVFTMNVVNGTNGSWSRKESFTKEEFKYIVNVTLTNNWTYTWVLGLAYLIFIATFGITSPISSSIYFSLGLIGIGSIATLLFTPFVVSFILYQFMKIRNFALRKKVVHSKNKVVLNYDEIDEQGIEGINQFTKVIPVDQQKPDLTKHE